MYEAFERSSFEFLAPIGAGSDPDSISRTVFEALLSVLREIHGSQLDLATALNLLLEQAVDLLDGDMAWVTLTGSLAAGRHRSVIQVGGRHEHSGQLAPGETGIGADCIDTLQALVAADYPGYVRHSSGPVTDHLSKDEGLTSVACAPLVDQDEVVGLFYIGWRHEKEPDAVDATVFSTIVSHAGLAVQNDILQRELAQQQLALSHALQVDAELSAGVIQGGGVEGICSRLRDLIGREVEFVPRSEVESEEGAGRGPAGNMAEVVLGGEVAGHLLAAEGPLELEDRATLESAAEMIALELTKRRSNRAVALRVGDELFGPLIAGGPYDSRVVNRADRLGFELTHPFQAIAIRFPGEIDGIALVDAVVEATAAKYSDVLLRRAGSRPTLLIALASGSLDIQALHSRLASIGALSTGVSRPLTSAGQAYREATACLRFAEAASTPGELIHGADLGPLRALLDAADLEALISMVNSALGSVWDAQQRGGAPLFQTLEAYLECGAHQAKAAEMCDVHISTLKYRMRRVKELIGDPLDGETRFQIWLMCRLLRFLERLGHEPFRERAESGTVVA